MESIANSNEDFLIDGLSFKLRPGASYITDRQSVTYHPQGSNIYKPNGGTKLIKISLTGDSWLDPSSVKVMFDLRNMTTVADQILRPLGNPHCFFRRMRILVNGAIIEDIDNFNRVSEMFNILANFGRRFNEDAEAFGKTYDHELDNAVKTVFDPVKYSGIIPSASQTVLFSPLSGLLKQKKFIPLRYSPVVLELELVDSMTDPIIKNSTNPQFTAVNTSIDWQIENVMIKADVCILDNALDNSYAQYLLSGKSLAINYNTYISQLQSMISASNVGQKAIRLNVNRSLSRLKSIFVTLIAPPFQSDYKTSVEVFLRDWNYFYSPLFEHALANNRHSESKEFEASVQIGAKQFPVYPIRSHSECYSQLKKTMGANSNDAIYFDISSHEYRTIKFIWATDCEKVPTMGFTGHNTMAGDNISISFTHKSTVPADYAVGMHIILHADAIMEIRDSGVEVSM